MRTFSPILLPSSLAAPLHAKHHSRQGHHPRRRPHRRRHGLRLRRRTPPERLRLLPGRRLLPRSTTSTKADFRLRARLLGKRDLWIEARTIRRSPSPSRWNPSPAANSRSSAPRAAPSACFPSTAVRDKLNFKMMCSYCHQIGTLGFRTPEATGRLGNHDQPHGRLRRPLPRIPRTPSSSASSTPTRTTPSTSGPSTYHPRPPPASPPRPKSPPGKSANPTKAPTTTSNPDPTASCTRSTSA